MSTQEEPQFIVGATYQMLADDHGAFRSGQKFVVTRIDSMGDARVGNTPVVRLRLRKNEVRLVSLPNNQEERTMNITTQQAYKALFEDFQDRVPVGSTVRYVRHWTDEDAQRWGASLPGDATDSLTIGEEYEIHEYGLSYATISDWGVPITCLEVVSTKPKSIKVKLNDTYTAEVYEDKIVVGCQTFSIDVVDLICKAHIEVCKS